MSHLHKNKKILNRVRRLQGQLCSVENALTNTQHDCIDVLQQVAAIRGAINGLMTELVELHLRHHVLEDVEHINEPQLNEFLALLKRYY